jgi:hypothetical protein
MVGKVIIRHYHARSATLQGNIAAHQLMATKSTKSTKEEIEAMAKLEQRLNEPLWLFVFFVAN